MMEESGFPIPTFLKDLHVLIRSTATLTIGDKGVSRLVSVLLSSASLSLSLPLSLTKQICKFIPLCNLEKKEEK